MDFPIRFSITTAPPETWIIVLAAALELLWILTLYALLKRKDLEAADRIVWTVVLCTTNLVGMLLYWFVAPPSKPGAPGGGARSEKELKEYFNKRSTSKYTVPLDEE